MRDYTKKGQIYQQQKNILVNLWKMYKMLNKIFVVILDFWRVAVRKSGPFFNSLLNIDNLLLASKNLKNKIHIKLNKCVEKTVDRNCKSN